MRELKLSLPLKGRRGANSYIAFDADIDSALKRIYGRSLLCLKVFAPKGGRIQAPNRERYTWGPCPACRLLDCVRVQNIFAQKHLAPRVYDIVRVDDRLALVTDYLQGPIGLPSQRRLKQVRTLAKELHLYKFASKTMTHEPNWVDGKFVDFGACCFRDVIYQKQLRERVLKSNGHKQVYQPVPELAVDKSRRDPLRRVEVMKLAGESFAKKSVLVLGCSVGWMARYAAKRGAKSVLGVDRENTELAYEVANWCEAWNVDFLEMDLNLAQQRQSLARRQYDIVFALAIVKWIGGYAPWIASLVKPGGVAYFESHGPKAEEFPMEALKRDFRVVELLGETKDLGTRKVYRARKE